MRALGSVRFGALRAAAALVVAIGVFASPAPIEAGRRFPNVLIVTVDTLRLDRLSGYGYGRPTSPAMDALMARGARFTEGRTVEPLTAPALCSMLTARYPHQHGASRNSLEMRPGLLSLPQILAGRGYRTAAVIGNWTLRDRLTGLGAHFKTYREVFSRKRWFGLVNSEATAADLNDQALAWLDGHQEADPHWPFLLWVHYVEPHAPYRFHRQHASALGIDTLSGRAVTASERYDTEVAFVDRAIGTLLEEVRGRVPDEDLLIVLASDHGESLGEHGYWGHGRHLYDVTLRIPLAIVWPGTIPAATVTDLASNLDLAPTLLGLLGLPVPDQFQGHDWSRVLRGERVGGGPEATFHQAHKGAAHGDSRDARRTGLLAVGMVAGAERRKEVRRVRKNQRRLVFDLAADPREKHSLVPLSSAGSAALEAWLGQVQDGLVASDSLPPPSLDQETLDQLRALGYID